MELPTEIWDMIVMQSTETIEDKVKNLSLNEMSALIDNLNIMKEKKLNDKWEALWFHTIIVDNYGNQFMVCKKSIHKKKYITLRRVYRVPTETMFGNYWFNYQTIYRNTAIMNLETNKIVWKNQNFIQPTDIDYDCWKYLNHGEFGVSNFIKVIQKQSDIELERINYANSLTKSCRFYHIEGRLSLMGDCYFLGSNVNDINASNVVKMTHKYIFYEEVDRDTATIKKVDKKYVVKPPLTEQ
jgi:hypothetical protein